jgi:hypothetical protein
MFFSVWRNSPTPVRAASFFKFLDHTQWHTTAGRTPLDEGSARGRDLYLITHSTSRQTNIHTPGGISFCILLFSVIHPYLFLCLDCPAFCLFVFTHNTQYKHPWPQRDSNPQPQQELGHWDRLTTLIPFNNFSLFLDVPPKSLLTVDSPLFWEFTLTYVHTI